MCLGGLSIVKNDLVAILDADISVEPETLDEFEIIEQNHADFVNGTRQFMKWKML